MNKKLFSSSTPGRIVPPADTVNNAGGKAYARSPEEALAQFAATGCFGDTFYVNAEDQLADVLKLADQCSPEWIAKCALYARAEGLMKDMPAMLCAVLAKRDVAMLKRVFLRVIDNGKMLRNFVQIVRSGVVGRKSFGTAVKRLVQKWFAVRSNEQLFHANIGDKPSLGDVVKMAHPKPRDNAQSMMFAYLMGKPVAAMGLLPEIVQQLALFKLGVGEVPDVNFQFLSSLPLTDAQWAQIAERASWTTLRMNLNTFARHGVFADGERAAKLIGKMTDPAEIAKARPMPYQLFTTFLNLDGAVPEGFRMVLARALDTALSNVPKLPPNVIIGVDVSGSMRSAVTGQRGTATTAARCVDVAAIFACALLRANPTARMVAFDTTAHTGQLGGSVFDAAQKLASFGGGGTDCSIPLQIAAEQPKCDAVVVVSDNESWFDSSGGALPLRTGGIVYSGSKTMAAWRHLQARHPNAKLVCIDLTPSTTRQTSVEPGILNVGGFSDAVFDVVAKFLNAGTSWKDVVQAVDIDAPIG